MAFSGALTLTDLNDFITPSQACIKPVEQVNAPEQKAKEAGAADTEIRIDAGGAYYEVQGSRDTQTGGAGGKKLEQAQINLNDCLACSGCITSAESVLITLQSHTEVMNFLAANPAPPAKEHKLPVLSIAPQCLASLAARVSSSSRAAPVGPRQMLHRVRAFCTGALGFARVCDTTFARHVALLEHSREFFERREKGEGLPMLASACPGWICYAEKTHAEMLPFIARTKSPQQVMGTLVKTWMARAWGKRPDEVYHVSVMPCYDKKLEASRKDFYDEMYATRDVDCVITTGELELMMREKGWDISTPVAGEDEDAVDGSVDDHDYTLPELLTQPGTSSGSYMHTLIDDVTAASPEPLELDVRSVRTSDYEEYTLRSQETGAIVFKGAKCYGFRNLQNVVRKVGREAGVQVGRGAAGKMGGGLRARVRKGAGKDDGADRRYDYVEVMACPGGCVNGGGQLKPPPRSSADEDEEGYARDWAHTGVEVNGGGDGVVQDNARWGDKEWTKQVERAYWHDLPTPPASPTSTPPAEPWKNRGNGNGTGSAGTDRAFARADQLAAKLLGELCRPIATSAPAHRSWRSTMDDGAEDTRRRLFRTEYRAVESDVVGLAVKW